MPWQNTLVALIVLAATGYAAWQLLPGRLRQRLANRLGQQARRAGWARAGQRIEHALQPSGGCHGCEAQGRCASADAPAGAPQAGLPQAGLPQAGHPAPAPGEHAVQFRPRS